MRTKVLASVMGISLTLAMIVDNAVAQDYPQAVLKMKETSRQVNFDHQDHIGAECTTCHHKNEGIESYRMCSTCHSTDKAEKSKDNSYYKIIHGKKKLPDDRGARCISCHAQVATKTEKLELTSCSTCHQK